MTFTLVRANTIVDHSATSTTSPLSVPCTASTVGNLLVMVIGTGFLGSFSGFTTPSGWFAVPQSGSNYVSAMFYYPNCPAGITAASLAWAGGGGGFMWAQILEFHDSAGSNPSPLDVTGIKSGTTSPQAIATSGPTTANNDLVVSGFNGQYSATTSVSITAGAGFTTAGAVGQAVKQLSHGIIDYNLDAGASGSTPTDSVTFATTLTNVGNGIIATFKTAAGAPAGGPQFLTALRVPVYGPTGNDTTAVFA